MLVGLLIVFDFPVMFFSSNDYIIMETSVPPRTFSQLASLDQQLRTSVPPLGKAVQEASGRMSSSLSRSGPGVQEIPGKFNFGVSMGGGYESSGDGGLESDRSLFIPEAESLSGKSLVGGVRGRHGLTIDDYTNSEHANSGYTGPLFEICPL